MPGARSSYRAVYRVLVLANPRAKLPHQKVTAICLEQNLVGRGKTPEAALGDLGDCVIETMKYQFENAVPEHHPDPSPELLQAFKSSARSLRNGDIILSRANMHLRWSLEKTRAASPGRKDSRRVICEPCAV